MKAVYWDIETVGKPRAALEAQMPEAIKNPLLPYDLANPVVPNFQHGSMKDAVKLAAWVEEKVNGFHADHRAKIAKWQKEVEDDRFKYFDRAALDPSTGEVKLIGYWEIDYEFKKGKLHAKDWGRVILCSQKIPSVASEELRDKGINAEYFDTEAAMIKSFLAACAVWRGTGREIWGYNTSGFDVRFIYLRAAINRVGFPINIMEKHYVSSLFGDLMDRMRCGKRELYISLNDAARTIGVEGKLGDGAQFPKLWEAGKFVEAIRYLHDDDLRLTRGIAEPLLGVAQ